MNLELFLLWDVLAFPNSSKITLVAIARSAALDDLEMYDSKCIALLVFPEPVSPVKIIDCGFEHMSNKILLAVKKEKLLISL